MKENGDVVQFLKQKNYEMVNNNLGSGSFGKTVLLKDPFIDELFVAKSMSLILVMIRRCFSAHFCKRLRLCIN